MGLIERYVFLRDRLVVEENRNVMDFTVVGNLRSELHEVVAKLAKVGWETRALDAWDEHLKEKFE